MTKIQKSKLCEIWQKRKKTSCRGRKQNAAWKRISKIIKHTHLHKDVIPPLARRYYTQEKANEYKPTISNSGYIGCYYPLFCICKNNWRFLVLSLSFFLLLNFFFSLFAKSPSFYLLFLLLVLCAYICIIIIMHVVGRLVSTLPPYSRKTIFIYLYYIFILLYIYIYL